MELTFEAAVNEQDFTFHYDYLSQFSSAELSEWLKANYARIQRHLVKRLSHLQATRPDLIQAASHSRYLNRAAAALPALKTDNIQHLPYVHFIALFGAVSSDFTCHEVIFGHKRLVSLPCQTLHVLKLFTKASTVLKQSILIGLADSPSTSTNPVYTSIYRYTDLANELGLPVNPWLCNYYTKAELFKAVAAFKKDAFKPDDDLKTFLSPSRGATSLWWMSLLFSPLTGTSLDYLYREDYSCLAIHPERELTEADLQFLQLYLSASVDGQRKCRFSLLCNAISPGDLL